MLKKKQPKEHDPVIQSGVDAARKMLMNRGYYIRDIISASDNEVDLIAIREGLLNSEKMIMRIVLPEKEGGLGINTVRNFFARQARVFGVTCILVSLAYISKQTLRYARQRDYAVYDKEWLKANTDFEIIHDA
jgi:hypothetical protein